jgi:hypothetical protein
VLVSTTARRFPVPPYTQVPNEIIDEMASLSGSEFKVLTFIARRTLGFGRRQMKIGIRQICYGLPGKFPGTGLSNRCVIDALRSLEKDGWIYVWRNKIGATNEYDRSAYTILFEGEDPENIFSEEDAQVAQSEVVRKVHHLSDGGGEESSSPVVKEVHHNKKERKETKKTPPPPPPADSATQPTESVSDWTKESRKELAECMTSIMRQAVDPAMKAPTSTDLAKVIRAAGPAQPEQIFAYLVTEAKDGGLDNAKSYGLMAHLVGRRDWSAVAAPKAAAQAEPEKPKLTPEEQRAEKRAFWTESCKFQEDALLWTTHIDTGAEDRAWLEELAAKLPPAPPRRKPAPRGPWQK